MNTEALANWRQQVQDALAQSDYNQAVSLYEQAIASEPEVKSHYLQLGLLLLLQGQEEEAQMIWFDALSTSGSDTEVQKWIDELVEVLDIEAQKREASVDYQTAWRIRQYIYENQAENIDNVLRSLSLSIQMKLFNPDEDVHLQQMIALLPDLHPTQVEGALLLQVLQKVLGFDKTSSISLQLVDACLAHYQNALAMHPEIAEWHYRLGTIYAEIQQNEQAIACYKEALKIQPEYAEPYFSLGNIDLNQGNYELAISKYQQAIAIKPNFAKPYINLAYIQERQEKLGEAIANLQKAIEIQPDFAEAYRNQGLLLSKIGRYDKAVAILQKATEVNPNYAEVYSDLGSIFSKINQLEKSISYYQKAIQIQPDYGDAYWNLIVQLNNKKVLELRRSFANQYLLFCSSNDIIRAKTAWIGAYFASGLHSQALNQFLELETYIHEISEQLTVKEIEALYSWLLIAIPHLRDELEANSNLSKLIGGLYVEKVLATKSITMEPQHIQPVKDGSKYLKIGFVSSHFFRNAVGWLCFDVIRELSQITPYIYLYKTNRSSWEDDRTRMFKQVATKFYNPIEVTSGDLSKMLSRQIQEDNIDILVDLDSITVPINIEILYYQPAPVCISWLGFDAPFISKCNYYLSDSHLHPEGIESSYREQIVRVPDLCLAISGLEMELANRDELRHSLGIDEEQVAYLCMAPGRKVTIDMVKAQVGILRCVPNSILIYKGITGDSKIIQSIYQQECASQIVDFSRLKFIEPQFPEEKHRTTYLVADVMLDSYPYNGGTHTIEGLWFDLPLITRTGSQPFMGKVGYACLASLGITEGIASSWEKYTEWGIEFGLSSDLRNYVRERLAQSKQPETLASLWNPKKLAKNMYDKFRELRFIAPAMKEKA